MQGTEKGNRKPIKGIGKYRERFDTERVLNVANIVTASRIIIIPFFAQFIIQNRYVVAFFLFFICGVSDAIDGFIARLFKVKSKFGMLLDPIADKALMATSFIVLGISGKMPPWLVVTVISRDAIILGGSLIILIFIGIEGISVVPSGKLNTILQVFTVGFVLFILAYPELINKLGIGKGVEISKRTLFIATGMSTLYSGLRYFIKGFSMLTEL